MKLPSTKILFILIACIATVGAIFFAVKSTEVKERTEDVALTNELGDTLKNPEAQEDGDLDGLKNWEEALWGTDPSKPDTDGDGTSDSEEIRLSRDPNAKGPNDGPAAANGGASSRQSELTRTDSFARNLMQEILILKNEDGEIAPAEQATLVQKFVDNDALSLEAKLYAYSDLNVGDRNDKETLRIYGNRLGVILVDVSPKDLEPEILIYTDALQKEDPERLRELDPIIEGYEKLLEQYVALEAPRSIALQHLNLVNSISRMLADIRAMRAAFTDPMLSIAGVNSYQKDVITFMRAMQAINKALASSGINYEKGEGGYIFMNSSALPH